MGGTVAFEMAQPPHRAGREVVLLALLDTAAPCQMPAPMQDDGDGHRCGRDHVPAVLERVVGTPVALDRARRPARRRADRRPGRVDTIGAGMTGVDLWLAALDDDGHGS